MQFIHECGSDKSNDTLKLKYEPAIIKISNSSSSKFKKSKEHAILPSEKESRNNNNIFTFNFFHKVKSENLTTDFQADVSVKDVYDDYYENKLREYEEYKDTQYLSADPDYVTEDFDEFSMMEDHVHRLKSVKTKENRKDEQQVEVRMGYQLYALAIMLSVIGVLILKFGTHDDKN